MRFILTIFISSLISGCVTLPDCSVGSLPGGPKRIFKDIEDGFYLTSDVYGSGLGITFGPRITALSYTGSDVQNFEGASLSLKNKNGEALTTKCNTTTYMENWNDSRIRRFRPSFTCNEAKFSQQLNKFLKKSNSIHGVITYYVVGESDGSQDHRGIEQQEFKIDQRFIQNYKKNNMVMSIADTPCVNHNSISTSPHYDGGNLYRLVRVSEDVAYLESQSVDQATYKDALLTCMKNYGAKDTSPNNHKQIEINIAAKAACKAILK